jgi:hypothetical protein
MKHTLRIAALTAITAAVLALAGTASGSRSVPAKSGKCPIVTGHKWILPYAPYTSGTQYDLSVHGNKITCKQAAGYVQKLVTQHVHTGVAFSGGPPGWTCKASPSKTGLAYFGTCQPKSEGFLPADYFAWTVG